MRRRFKPPRAALYAGLLALALASSAPLALYAIGWWIDFGQQPIKSDVLVVLTGDYARPAYAAELFAQGFAPEVWLSRPRRLSALAQLDLMDIHLPREEDINREILVKRGVPKDRIRFYGRDVVSTADEASALRGEFPSRGKRILVVTSRFHARRALITLRRFLPEADVRVVATPYEHFDRRWWKDKELSQNAMFEVLKTFYFLSGGRMR
jgi:uncharacterized SAM-binding protein YcdF (DUF218 family)